MIEASIVVVGTIIVLDHSSKHCYYLVNTYYHFTTNAIKPSLQSILTSLLSFLINFDLKKKENRIYHSLALVISVSYVFITYRL